MRCNFPRPYRDGGTASRAGRIVDRMLPNEPGESVKGAPAHIHVVDDDASVRAAMVRLLGAEDYAVSAFHSAESFLAQHDPDAHGCIILDVAMPGLDGLALQQALFERGNRMPVIFLTGHADVPMTVHAMR